MTPNEQQASDTSPPPEPRVLAPWHDLYTQASPAARQHVAQIVREQAAPLAKYFYDTLLADDDAAGLLSHQLVAHRLNGSLQRWMLALFDPADPPDVVGLLRLQQRVGEVHARLGVSIPLVSRGARLLKERISHLLRASSLSRDDLSWAHQYLVGLFDLALEVMSEAYLHDARRGARADEAYRLFSLGQNVAAERERQRAAVLEWAQGVLLAASMRNHRVQFCTLRGAEFGMWMHHKGAAMFDGTEELGAILSAMAELDDMVLPALTRAVADDDNAAIAAQMQALQRNVDDIKYLLMTLFDRVAAIDGGRDPLTQLLNRRFLAPVLAREISMANSGKTRFSVFLADVDHFKLINDSHGHTGGDNILRQVAELLQDTCRTGDYVFRYGGEEFLVVLVDADNAVLERVAETFRSSVERHRFRLPEGQALSVTISIGAATFDGDPDPQRLIGRADAALYQAKQRGRNGWVVG